jgi:TolB-like protein
MSAESKPELQMEIGHVLAMDIVGYSKLLIHEQSEVQQRLNEIVRGTHQFRVADAQGKLIRLPTGDGMALVFFGDPKAPIECANEIATALKHHPNIQLRMGIHSGPVNEVLDVNERTNVAGAGIDIAQRVMDCGDAGHILLSKRVADDLAPYSRWNPHLHELGECEVKHGRKLLLVNFYTDEVGNPRQPQKFAGKFTGALASPVGTPSWRKPILLTGFLLLLGTLGILLWRFSHTARVAPAGTVSIPEKSIAVLPFENRSEDKSNAYFADGVQDEILTRLSKIGDLKVISRTSTRRYKSAPENLSEIGKQLGVANLLEGSVQKTKDEVRVNVQLIRAANDSHLWAETFDRKLTDIFAVETEVAATIADKLQAALTGSEQRALASKPTANLDAYDAYLHGLDFDRRTESPADLLEAIRYLELAVKLDPMFALAWARLGRVEANFYFQDIDISPARRESARNAVETAVRLQPDLGESWLALGYYRFYCERNLKLARAAFENARQRLPNDSDVLLALSILDRSQGRSENGLTLQSDALRLDPRNANLFFERAETFVALRRFEEARAALDHALEITPNDRELIAVKAITYHAEGDLERAHQLFGETFPQPWTARAYPLQLRQLMFERNYTDMISRLRPLLAEPAPSAAINRDSYYWLLGMAQKLTGDFDGARPTFAQGRDFLLANIQKSGGPQGGIHAMIALMYAGAGDKPNALREANRAIELEGDDTYLAPSAEEVRTVVEVQTGETASAVARLPKLLHAHYFSWLSAAPLTPSLLRIDPVWDPLRNDPQFQKLIQEVNP